MTQGERVKELRKSLHLTLEAFGDRLGVTKVTISRIENDMRALTDQMARGICREFSVNEEWLRTGAGEMFIEYQDEIAESVAARGLTPFDEAFLRTYISLPDAARAAVRRFMEDTVAASRRVIDDKVESYRAELTAQEEDAGESSASPTTAAG